MVLVLLQNEVCGRADDRIQRGEFAGDKTGNFLEGLTFESDKKVIAAGDQVHGINFGILVDPLGNIIKSLSSLRCDAYFDQRGHLVDIGLVPVDHGVVSADDPLFFHSLKRIDDIDLISSQDHCHFSCRDTAVLLYNSQYFLFQHIHGNPPTSYTIIFRSSSG